MGDAPGGPALYALEGDEPVCTAGGGGRRAFLHLAAPIAPVSPVVLGGVLVGASLLR